MSHDEDELARTTREIALPTSGTQPMPRVAAPAPARSEAHGARLVVLRGPDAGRVFLLGTRAVIGRADGHAVQLRDEAVSRAHAEIVRDREGVFHVIDIGSRHGTLVNGRRVPQARIAYGDRITAGETVLLFAHRDPAEDRLIEREQLETLGRLGAGLVHDMNNLLAVTLSCATVLDEHVRDPELLRAEQATAIECLADLVTSVERGRELNAHLLSLAKRQPRATEELDLSELLSECVDLAARTMSKRIAVERRIARGVRVVGTRSELHRVVMNLLLNARDAMPGGGHLTISLLAEREGDDADSAERVARLRIQDTGPGMDDATRARIFEPLFTTKDAGTGLGLATVARVVREHGGEIRCDSTLGTGTTFEITLPRVARERGGGLATRPPLGSTAR